MDWWDSTDDLVISNIHPLLYVKRSLDTADTVILKYVKENLRCYNGDIVVQAMQYCSEHSDDSSFMKVIADMLSDQVSPETDCICVFDVINSIKDYVFGGLDSESTNLVYARWLAGIIDCSHVTADFPEFVQSLVENYKTSYPDVIKILIAIIFDVETLRDLEHAYKAVKVSTISMYPLRMKCEMRESGIDYMIMNELPEIRKVANDRLQEFKKTLSDNTLSMLSYDDLKLVYIYCSKDTVV